MTTIAVLATCTPIASARAGLAPPADDVLLANNQQISPIDFDWVSIPAGEFLMGSDKRKDPMAFDDGEMPQHKVYLPEYRIARVPVTNTQYQAFVKAGYPAPEHWGEGRIPAGTENHPVTLVSWDDAKAFCRWARVSLPIEAEWEKAARGTDGRIWPWGNEPPTGRLCNFDSHVRDTTPVDEYPAGASPYGVLDMAGNVWEWTSSKYKEYPYDLHDSRDSATEYDRCVLRGGSWCYLANHVRCAYRARLDFGHWSDYVGFRVASPGFHTSSAFWLEDSSRG